jgi:hypothetical protein
VYVVPAARHGSHFVYAVLFVVNDADGEEEEELEDDELEEDFELGADEAGMCKPGGYGSGCSGMLRLWMQRPMLMAVLHDVICRCRGSG